MGRHASRRGLRILASSMAICGATVATFMLLTYGRVLWNLGREIAGDRLFQTGAEVLAVTVLVGVVLGAIGGVVCFPVSLFAFHRKHLPAVRSRLLIWMMVTAALVAMLWPLDAWSSPFATLLLLGAFHVFALILRSRLPDRIHEAPYPCCPCGYSLHGNTSNRCPECARYAFITDAGLRTRLDRLTEQGATIRLEAYADGMILLAMARRGLSHRVIGHELGDIVETAEASVDRSYAQTIDLRSKPA
jgi:hypothetical protein